MTQASEARPWWRNAVVYEVYPRSFADGNGDGEGDLAGLTQRLGYLAELGVDALWLAPWYPSPLADGGYDITDYRDIHPTFGSLSDADAFLAAAHRLGLRVIIDLVANHTSQEHPWFRAALAAGPGSAERERYLFRDGRGPGGAAPPNNWISAFGDSAWTRTTDPDGTPGQWYLHTFAPAQPDLNWKNAEVRAEFVGILRFWLDRGVDGFRIDAVPAMAKKDGLPDAEYDADLTFDSAGWIDNPHWDVDGVHEILREWRRVAEEYPGERVFVAEAVVAGPQRLARYLRPDELQTAFNFDYVHARWDPTQLRSVIDDTLAALGGVGAAPTWAMSSHDEIRHLSRFGADVGWRTMGESLTTATDLDLGRRRARAAILLMLALPGGAYLYQGEELGLPEVNDLPDAVLQDPVFHRSGGSRRGRDGCRVPLPWDGDRPPFGFSSGARSTWLPQPTSWGSLTAQAQQQDPSSMLNLYRSALSLRARTGDLAGEDLTWEPAPARVLAFRRGQGLLCMVNLSDHPVPVQGRVLLGSSERIGTELGPDHAVWLDIASK